MADFTKTISNSVNIFGASPSSLWGVMLWGENFGEGTQDLPIEVEKLIDNSQSLSDSLSKESDILISNEQSVTSETTYEDLQDGSGYYYVFTKPTTDAEQRNLTTWTDATPDTESWTSASVSSPTWSEQ